MTSRPIDGNTRLFRRISENYLVPAPDAPGGRRISSAAFSPSSDGSGVSVNIEDEMQRRGISPADLLALPPNAVGVAFVSAAQVRAEQLDVNRQPLPDDPSHGNITGNVTGAKRKRLARAAQAQWAVAPS
jgi:hypothetical protein